MADQKKTLELQIKVAAEQAAVLVKGLSGDFKALSKEALSVTQKLDKNLFKNAEESAKKAAASLKLFGANSNELKQVQQNLKNAAIELGTHGFSSQSSEVQKLVVQYKQLEKETQKLDSQSGDLFSTIGQLKNQLGSLASVAAAVKLDKTLAGAAGFALQQADAVRGMREELGIMLGDMEAGAGFFKELQAFNFYTPFNLDEISTASKVLLAAKVPLSDMTEYLTRFGDLAQGNAQRFASFTSAFSKASAKGKADMEVLNVFVDQGVQIFDALANEMNVNTQLIPKMASEGKISFETLTDAIKTMTDEGGQYFNTLESAAFRLSGVQAGLKESVNALAASFGEILAPAASGTLSVLTNIVDAINNSPLMKGILAGALATVTAMVNALAAKALVSLLSSLTAVKAAMAGLLPMLANPVFLAVAAAVGIATTAFVAYSSAQQKANEETRKAALETKQYADELERAKRALGKMSIPQLDFHIQMTEDQLKEARESVSKLENKIKGSNSSSRTMTLYVDSSGKPLENSGASKLKADLAGAKILVEELSKSLSDLQNIRKEKMDALKQAAADFTTEWSERDIEGVEKVERQREKSIKNL